MEKENVKGVQFPDVNDPKKPIKLTEISDGDFFTLDGVFVCKCLSQLGDSITYYDNNDGHKKTATYTHSDRTGAIWPRWCELYYNQDESLTI